FVDFFFFFSSRRRHTRWPRDWSSDVCSSDLIGDPSGRSAERPILDPEEIDRMAARFFESAYTILDPKRTEVRFNGEWLKDLDFRSEERRVGKECRCRGWR